MTRKKATCFLCVFLLTLASLTVASAYQQDTLYYGCTGQEVVKMQQALIDLGFLGGTADGIFGLNTENAVRKFQKKYKLGSDGLAGAKTLELLYRLQSGKISQQDTNTGNAESSGTQNNNITQNGSLFGGNYSTIRKGTNAARVKVLQKALIWLGYLKGSADGKYGTNTTKAVTVFQRKKGLSADGLAGKKTLTALEKAYANNEVYDGNDENSSTDGSGPQNNPGNDFTTSQPAVSVSVQVGNVKLLHWFNDIKPRVKTGQIFMIVDPVTGISWKLKLYSAGRHADSEPLTASDTANMVRAFGNVNTWNQKAVYVQLPDGTWTIGSMHDMPHLSGSIADNNFDGHLCVHFLRDMDEARKNDPQYGVSNQQTIRAFWKSLTGEVID